MIYNYDNTKFNMPLTLEQHLNDLADRYEQVRELRSLWVLFRKRLEEELIHSRGVFVNYSLHDGTHSRSIIKAVERFLGEERIMKLSATDTFMILACAYAHDYGMAYSFNKVYDILGSRDFQNFINDKNVNPANLEEEDSKAIRNLLRYLNDEKPNIPLNDMYLYIQVVLQLYLRPNHWKGVVNVGECIQGLFQGILKSRFFKGMEGITEICMAHGQDQRAVMKLSERADGIVGDDYHPRFIAAMIRLGDLLDLDNSRFPLWFVQEVSKGRKLIPKMSVLHFRKHEAVSHLLITHKKIEITAHCLSDQDGYEVARLVNEWTGWLADECRYLVLNWDKIAQPDFGRPPGDVKVEIYVDNKPYSSQDKDLQMQMSQERVMKLLEGTSIYKDEYVGIREMLQNAVDASLLQLWYDILQNKYISLGLSRRTEADGLDLMELFEGNRRSIFGNYDITVELIQDLYDKKIYIVFKDKGIGITEKDVEFIANIGTSKENNKRLCQIMEHMPKWLKPSGVFGLGLQSVFQLTDCIEFYTRQPNEPEKLITLHSYGKNKGKIEIREVPKGAGGLFYDNATQGTNVKIAINPEKLFGRGFSSMDKNSFIYYDPEFDTGNELDVLYAELGMVIPNRIKETRLDYFNIYYQPMKRLENGEIEKERKLSLRDSFFYPEKNTGGKKSRMECPKGIMSQTVLALASNENKIYNFTNNRAYYWDAGTKRFYRLTVRPCKIVERDSLKRINLPDRAENLYHVCYKFNTIADADSIYSAFNRHRRQHAGFLDWDILILDDKPADYLNIDRDRLRDNAIREEELLIIRKKLLERWCEYFIEETVKKEKSTNRFEKTPEILLSLLFLFYQNVSPRRFKKFMEPYKSFLLSNNFVLGEENIPAHLLYNDRVSFQTKVTLPEVFSKYSSAGEDAQKADITEDTEASEKINASEAAESCEITEIYEDTVMHLPHRLVHIEQICRCENNELLYRLKLGASGEKPTAIDMDEAAVLFDYINVFEPYEAKLSKINYETVIKKVFKPNRKYADLLMPFYPHTFNKGRNFRSPLDYCIRWYILSPFDVDSVNMLRSMMDKGEDVKNEFLRHMKSCGQLQRCIRYILNQRFGGLSEEEKADKEKSIRREYDLFVKDFYEILYKNSEIVKRVFAELSSQ